jgi:hypothetical protein
MNLATLIVKRSWNAHENTHGELMAPSPEVVGTGTLTHFR